MHFLSILKCLFICITLYADLLLCEVLECKQLLTALCRNRMFLFVIYNAFDKETVVQNASDYAGN